MEFEWDPERSARDQAKDGISFPEGATVLGDQLAITHGDPDHPDEEDHFATFGHSSEDQLIVVAHTHRGGRTRIISARLATHRERNLDEEV